MEVKVGVTWEQAVRTQEGDVLVEKVDGRELIMPADAAKKMADQLPNGDLRKTMLMGALDQTKRAFSI